MTFLSALTTRRCIFAYAFALTTIASSTNAFAQRFNMLVDVPFAFQDGSRTFPAGSYRIRATGENMIVLQSKDSDQVKLLMTVEERSLAASDAGKLVFHKYGDQYFLSDIWLADSTVGRQVLTSRAEKNLRRSPANRQAPGAQIALNIAQP